MSSKENIISVFEQHFKKPCRVFFAPGRINLIGEHVDYNDGFVMPAAIDKGIWIAVAKNKNAVANFVSVDMNDSFSIALNAVEKQSSWKNYVLGVLHILLQKHFLIEGFECVFGGDLPTGAGLSSSAALEGGLLFALNELFELKLNRVELAQLAQAAEHTFPGVQCGIMDMFASLNGKKDHVLLLDCKSLNYKYYPLQLKEYEIVLLNTKVHHTLASGEYNKRRKDCEVGKEILQEKLAGNPTFREISSKNVEAYRDELGEQVANRCLFVTQEIERTNQAAQALQAGDIKLFGKLLYETHDGLSKLYEVSCKQSDFIVDATKKNDEVIGARQMGGGFGGCIICLMEKKSADNIIEQLLNSYQQQFNIMAEVYRFTLEDGTREV
jgi:galactokinase